MTIKRRSRALRGKGILRAAMIGSKTVTAIKSLIAAKLMGGRSRKPSLMNNQTVLQIRHVIIQTNNVFILSLVASLEIEFGVAALPPQTY